MFGRRETFFFCSLVAVPSIQIVTMCRLRCFKRMQTWLRRLNGRSHGKSKRKELSKSSPSEDELISFVPCTEDGERVDLKQTPTCHRRCLTRIWKRKGQKGIPFSKAKRNALSKSIENDPKSAEDYEPIPFDRLQGVASCRRYPFYDIRIVKDSGKPWSSERYYFLKRWREKCDKFPSLYLPTNEKNALQELVGSPFIISLLDVYQFEDSIYHLTDFAQGGSLMSYMRKRTMLSHEECVFFSANMVSAIKIVHDKGFVHRDIRPENFWISSDGYLKLVDFGLAKRLTKDAPLALTACGTAEFTAPEVSSEAVGGYGKAVDWWGLGCAIVEMYCGFTPFFDKDTDEIVKKAWRIGEGSAKFIPPAKMNLSGLEASDLVCKLLTKDSERLGRNGSREVEEHKYFSKMDFEKISKKEWEAPFIPRMWELLFLS